MWFDRVKDWRQPQHVQYPSVTRLPNIARPLRQRSLLRAITLRQVLARARRALAQAHAKSDLVLGLEDLKDVHWEIHETAARYRDLLDAQADVIMRCDAAGRLTYVNRTFTRTFGIERAACLGRPFEPVIIEGATAAAGQKIMTTAGPRWFAFEQHAVPTAPGEPIEIQIIGRDVTERRRHDAELEAARAQAETANRAKSRFLAAMSHEIRTPMNGILGMAALMRDTAMTPDQATFVDAIDSSATTLRALIDDILDFSKIEAGKLELDTDTFVLADSVQSVVELLAPQAAAKGIDLAWAIDPALPYRVTGDAGRVRQILTNLAGNAVKFTERGGVLVTVGADQVTAQIKLTVTDTGPGIQPSTLATLFTEFEQGDTASHQREGGTGLGLAISRSLARAMGGDVTALSTVGEGSTFIARVGLTQAPHRLPRVTAPTGPTNRVLVIMPPGVERDAVTLTLGRNDVPYEAISTDDAALALIESGARASLPFTLLLGDARSGIVGLQNAIAAARTVAGNAAVRGAVVIATGVKPELGAYRAAGIENYLVRPIRPQSLLRLAQTDTQYPTNTLTTAARPELTSTPNSTVRQTSSAHRVLLVEDNDINALLAVRLLTASGCTIVRAANGQAALDLVRPQLLNRAQPFDLILMDVHMPVMDGLEATPAIKALFQAFGATSPPIIALTANAFPEDRARCIAAGMDDYLSKPFDRGELDALLIKWLDKQSRTTARALADTAAGKSQHG